MAAEAAVRAGSPELMANVCDGLGAVSRIRGDAMRSATLLSAGHHLRERIGVAIWPDLQSQLERTRDACRAAMSTEDFDRAWAAGRVHDLSQAAALILPACSAYAWRQRSRAIVADCPPRGDASESRQDHHPDL